MTRIRPCILALVFTSIAILPLTGSAFHAGAPAKGTFTLNGSLSYMSLETTELVFADEISPGYTLSELDWETQLIIVGLTGTWRADRWSAGLGLWRSMVSMDGEMVDYDWLFEDIDAWSDRSISDAEAAVTVFDINGGYTVLTGDFLVDVVVGFRYDMREWEDDGGTYIYSDLGFRDDIGEFDDGAGITYDVDLLFPYIGVRGYCTAGPVDLMAIFIYSPLVEVEAVDFHINTDTHYEDEFSGMQYVAVGVEGSIDVAENVRAGLAVFFQQISEDTGDNYVVEDDIYSPDGAGYDTTSFSLTASASYLF